MTVDFGFMMIFRSEDFFFGGGFWMGAAVGCEICGMFLRSFWFWAVTESLPDLLALLVDFFLDFLGDFSVPLFSVFLNFGDFGLFGLGDFGFFDIV